MSGDEVSLPWYPAGENARVRFSNMPVYQGLKPLTTGARLILMVSGTSGSELSQLVFSISPVEATSSRISLGCSMLDRVKGRGRAGRGGDRLMRASFKTGLGDGTSNRDDWLDEAPVGGDTVSSLDGLFVLLDLVRGLPREICRCKRQFSRSRATNSRLGGYNSFLKSLHPS